MLYDDKGNYQGLYALPEIIYEDDKVNITLDKKDKEKLTSIVNKVLQRNGLSKLNTDEIMNQVQELPPSTPTINFSFEVNTNNYRKSIIKIIYELAYYWLGHSYLEDEVSVVFSQYLQSDSFEVKGLIGNVDFISSKDMIFHEFGNEDSHTAILIKDNDSLFIYVNIFNIFYGLIRISDTASRYMVKESLFIQNNAVTGEIKKTTLLHEIDNKFN